MPISYIETASLNTTLNAPTATALSTASGSAPSYAARAWVNFNGTGTVAIRASGNVSSISDNGTGQYTVNLTTAMPDANYAVGACSYVTSSAAQTGPWWNGNNNTTSSFQIINYSTSGAYYDEAFMSAYIFR
jgi:hypothetical protein